MASVVRNVKDFQESQRRWLEDALGQPLHEEQLVWIQVFTPGAIPDESVRCEAMAELHRLAGKAAQHADEQRATPEEIEAAIEEAVHRVRYGEP